MFPFLLVTLLIVELLIARFGLYILLLRLYMLFDQEFLFLAVKFEVLAQSHAEQFLFLSMFFCNARRLQSCWGQTKILCIKWRNYCVDWLSTYLSTSVVDCGFLLYSFALSCIFVLVLQETDQRAITSSFTSCRPSVYHSEMEKSR